MVQLPPITACFSRSARVLGCVVVGLMCDWKKVSNIEFFPGLSMLEILQ